MTREEAFHFAKALGAVDAVRSGGARERDVLDVFELWDDDGGAAIARALASRDDDVALRALGERDVESARRAARARDGMVGTRRTTRCITVIFVRFVRWCARVMARWMIKRWS